MPQPLPGRLARAVAAVGTVHVEDDAGWRVRLGALDGGRVRLVGAEVADATAGRPDVAVWDHAVTEAGRVELLPFLREQAVSATAHRFGTPDALTDGVLPVGAAERRRRV